MIVVDIETSGLDFNRCGIWQIGAIDSENPYNHFIEESRIDDSDQIEESALIVTGKNIDQLRDKNKQSQKQMLIRFFRWCEGIKHKNFVCQNPQFDFTFIVSKSKKYDLKFNIPHRCFDLHSISSLKYFQTKGEFLLKDNKSNMDLEKTLEFCGMKDNRGAHNALEDAKLTVECFSRIVYGKNLIKEYSEFEVPKYLEGEQNDNL